ncbi:MAG: hypothetical protein VR64_05175 [Desulfatitalea sp. BRH_c12]|nr:MAG: hypothetical protein VR64_05175 [Desulfatitalea sp. BRH_c12]
MKNLAQRFLNQAEYERIDSAVNAAESRTGGEIVCLIQPASYHYPLANVIGAAFLSLPVALVLAPLLGGYLWIGHYDLWLFLGIFGVLFAGGHWLLDRWPWLKRRFVSDREIAEEVEEAAVTAFFRHGLYRTRDANGVLLFISVFEHKVWILADHGINTKVPADQWEAIVARLTAGIHRKESATAICEAIAAIGKILENHFPARADDRNELKNVIRE